MEGGGGGMGGAMTSVGGENQWLRHYARYENEAGEEVFIEDNDYFRKVTVGNTTTYTIHWTGVAMGAYYAVVFLNLALMIARYRRSRKRLLLWSTPAGEGDLAALETARQRVGCDKEVELYRCPKIHSPLLMGFSQPVILLPQELPAGSLEAALDHELTHLKRKDTNYMLVLTVFRCVYWFNPLVWLMVRTARQDMELCCDDDLLRGQGEEVRRAYGRAILDQMTAGDRTGSGLTTGFSGNKREVFARFRAMMDAPPKKKGRTVLTLAAVGILLSGSLVACQTVEPGSGEPQPGESEGVLLHYAWVESIDLENRTVTYIPMTWEQWENREDFWGEMGDLERETLPLTQDVSLYHTYDGARYPLNPTALVYTLGMSQAGAPGQLIQADTGSRAGEVIAVWLDVPSRLDLSEADLDFTGYCGTVYASGQEGARLLHGEEALSVDPCDAAGQDSDHARYALPLAEEFAVTEEMRSFLLGTSSANYPALFQISVVNGEATTVAAIDNLDSNMGGTLSLLPGVSQGELDQMVSHYNSSIDGHTFTASLEERGGVQGLHLTSAEPAVDLWVWPQADKGEPYRAEITSAYGRVSTEMPVFPLGLDGAGGTASLELADLTGDGTPELVYIWGYGGTRAWEDQAWVLNLASGEEYAIRADYGSAVQNLRAEFVEEQGENWIYQITGPDGQSGRAALRRQAAGEPPEGAVVPGSVSQMFLSPDRTALLSSQTFTVEGEVELYGEALGELSGQLIFSPSLRAFTLGPAIEMALFLPEEAG